MCLKKSHPRNAMENGLTTQFTKRVTRRPPGFLPAVFRLVRSIRSIIG